eukprot:TRINITY_DN5029_c0_g1_i1.p1 TRINITY_DN5029_c0_g1~~TRINITY_DN5029_c0_g1_i1.p1  ORF type:complete len:349 (+),score=-96.26 TRINITY_DN5029_c0_g1_i1:476-1522(+)
MFGGVFTAVNEANEEVALHPGRRAYRHLKRHKRVCLCQRNLQEYYAVVGSLFDYSAAFVIQMQSRRTPLLVKLVRRLALVLDFYTLEGRYRTGQGEFASSRARPCKPVPAPWRCEWACDLCASSRSSYRTALRPGQCRSCLCMLEACCSWKTWKQETKYDTWSMCFVTWCQCGCRQYSVRCYLWNPLECTTVCTFPIPPFPSPTPPTPCFGSCCAPPPASCTSFPSPSASFYGFIRSLTACRCSVLPVCSQAGPSVCPSHSPAPPLHAAARAGLRSAGLSWQCSSLSPRTALGRWRKDAESPGSHPAPQSSAQPYCVLYYPFCILQRFSEVFEYHRSTFLHRREPQEL